MADKEKKQSSSGIKSFKTTLNKLINLIWPVAFFAMVVFISFSAVVIYNNNAYAEIFVEGNSMNPTLIGNDNYAHYGKMDTSDYAKKHIARFDIIITYYPTEDYVQPYVEGGNNVLKSDATFKIKRVYALPKETFSLMVDDHDNPVFTTYVGQQEYVHEFDFGINKASRTKSKTTLQDHQYWIMGDNWASSKDSYLRGPVYYGNIVGVLHCIEGHGRINKSVVPNQIIDLVKEETIYYKRG